MNVEEKNAILRELSTKIGNRVWKIVEKTHEAESRELFCIPAPAPKQGFTEVEIIWTN